MVDILNRNMLIHKSVLWAKSGVGNYGEQTVSSPIQIDSRWDKETINQMSATGEIVVSDSQVMVDREVVVGSILRKGRIIDVPTTPDNLFEVVEYNE